MSQCGFGSDMEGQSGQKDLHRFDCRLQGMSNNVRCGTVFSVLGKERKNTEEVGLKPMSGYQGQSER